MTHDKIRAELCADHFERLSRKDTCSSCPSRGENEEIVRAMSKYLTASSPEQANTALLTELRSLRREMSDMSNDLAYLRNAVTGAGTGLDHRLTVMETKLTVNSSNKAATVAIVGVIVSILMSIVALIMEVSK